MINRYTLPEMGNIWTEENRFRVMLKVEIAACEAMASIHLIPKKSAQIIRKKASFNISQINQFERVTKHDVTAFLKSVGLSVGPDARFIHKGLTSSDVLDTALSLQIREGLDLLIANVKELTLILEARALEYQDTPMIGRSHGVHAEPVTFGLKMLLFYEEFRRNLVRLEAARKVISVGKISGAVGTYANIDPRVEERALKMLTLAVAPVSTQILQRDRHAEVLTTLSIFGGSLEKLATEIRHLQKTETLELEEPFAEGQTGSSAMPHKRNPVNCERIAGLARVLRGNALAALENIALWHERDITHSSVERVILPDSFILAHFMLREMIAVLKGLQVYPKNMMENIWKTRGLIFSQRVLLALVDKGLPRETAYKIVKLNSMRVWNDKHLNLKDLLLEDKEINARISDKEIEALFKLDYHLKHVKTIFKRVLGGK
ncbi:MAG: adenylosuccinate lyase [Candidatus Omnitrophica bacterium CG07_land_8_20_14_0_80_50_8]|nr:MAG: adenylosuccinate lyase [Candidatus Omnitrophica bacterium CG07_land_8_20_14_0_80_50_8]